MKKKMMLVLLFGLMCEGCASTQKEVYPETISPVEAKINSLAEMVVKRTNRIQQLQEANYIEVNGELPEEADLSLLPTLRQIVSLGKQYTGPLDTFVRRLSVFAGMSPPRFVGIKPTFDIIVTIDSDYKSVHSMLEQAGTLSGSRADVVYKAAENLVEVTYTDY